MSVTLTDDQWGAVMRALSSIASSRFTNPKGDQQRISREKMVERARDVCALLRIPFEGDGTCFRGFKDEAAT